MRGTSQQGVRPGAAGEPARSYAHGEFPAADLVRLKEEAGSPVVSVCIPARDEEATVGVIVASVLDNLTASRSEAGLVDELLVVDDCSTDATAQVASSAGARVVSTGNRRGGKGEAMGVALEAAAGDLIVFLDADVESFGPHFVTGLLGPLLSEAGIALVKGFYDRPLAGVEGEGGRVTELVARPLINLLFPDLSWVLQPLAGETAAPRSVLEKLTLAGGYGVELGLLLDVCDRFGLESIAQVDLGLRVHRNRPLADLRHQAEEVIQVALERAGLVARTPPER